MKIKYLATCSRATMALYFSLLLCAAYLSHAAGSYWCWFICGQNGEKISPNCWPSNVSEDPCAGSCYRYLFDDPVTCYYCDTTFWPCPDCLTGPDFLISASKYTGACGVRLVGGCFCQDNWVLTNPDSSFWCPLMVLSGLQCPIPNPGGSSW